MLNNEVMLMSNEEIGKFVKNDPNLAMYMQMMTQMNKLQTGMQKVSAKLEKHNVKIESIQNKVSTYKKSIDSNRDEISSVKQNHNELRDKLDTMKNDDTGVFELFKATARKRVWSLVDDKPGSIKHVLFYSSFMSKIYSDIFNYFGVNNSGSIRMSDSDTAIQMAGRWKPTMKYVKGKIDEFIRMQEKGTLKEERSKALDVLMEETNGGLDIVF